MKKRFLRSKWHIFSKLGKGRRKKQVWRRAKGRHSKIREKRKGYSKMPSVGFRSPKVERGKIGGMMPVMINNVKDTLKIGKNEIAVMSSKVGAFKKAEIAKKAVEMNIKFLNFNPEKYLENFKEEKTKSGENKK